MSFKLLARPCNNPPFSIKDFDSQPIGKGSFGQVYRSVHKQSKQVFAIKQISKIQHGINKYKDDYELEQINHQLLIMYQLNSDYIVKVYDHFEDERNIYLVMEYIDGIELYKGVIQKKRRLDDNQIAKIIYQLCMALKHLHEKNIIHRDIKPQNIVLMKSRNIKLIDFGTSNYVGPGQIRRTKTGSLPYFAPEIIKKDCHGEAVDVWCVGILLYEMFVLKTPFQQSQKTQTNILKNKVLYPSIMDPLMHDLIERILVKDQTKRIKVDDIIKHPWIIKHASTNKLRPSNFALKTKSKSKKNSKQKSIQNKSVSKPLPSNKSSSKKSLSKYSSSTTLNQNLHQKILRLQKQVKQGSFKQKLIEDKKKQLLQRKLVDLTEKIIKIQKQTLKYNSIVKINNKKIVQIQLQMKELIEFKEQNNIVDIEIQNRKKQLEVCNDKKNKLRMLQANLQTKLRINQRSRQNSRRNSGSKNKNSLSKHKIATLSAKSINKIPLSKMKTPKSYQKLTTEGSLRQSSGNGDLQIPNISNFYHTYNFNTN